MLCFNNYDLAFIALFNNIIYRLLQEVAEYEKKLYILFSYFSSFLSPCMFASFCVLECVSTDIPCPPGAKYADIIEFRTVALPGGQPARQDLIRLSAYNQHDEFLPQVG